MKPPVHRWKEHVTFADGRPSHWSFDGRPCWLASGLFDRNGVEIYEGDIVNVANGYEPSCDEFEWERNQVFFYMGEFLLVEERFWDCWETAGCISGRHISMHDVEVIGHIAEEQP